MSSKTTFNKPLLVLIALAFGLATTGLAAESTVDSVASADGVQIYYETAGKGAPALVFVHCWSCDRSYWAEQIEHFSADHKVVAIDLAGHGESGSNREDWTMAAFGGDVAAVLNKLDLYDVVLVGHSMGGPVCIEAARQAKDRVQAIIGIDNFQDMTMKFDPAQLKAFLAPFSSDFVGTTKAFVNAIVGQEADSSVKAFIINDMSSAPPDVAVPSITNTLGYDYAAALKDVHISIRTISSPIRPTNVEKNRTLAPDFQVDFIEEVGHFPMLEKPALFDRILARVVNEMTDEGGTDGSGE